LDGDVEAAKKLIARGLNVNQKNAFGSTPLSYAILKLDYEMIALLLDRGASPNCVLTTDGFTRSALANAIWHNDELLVEALINAGADINFRSVFGQTDAHRIASFTAEMLKQLIQVGLDVNMRDFAGKTAYDFLTLARVQQGEEVADEIAEVLKQYTQQ
jgi:ankyrin repeat protein